MKRKIIAIVIIVLVGIIGIYNIGEGRRCLVNALEYKGYEKCSDGIYRCRDIQETDTGLIMIERSFDVKLNRGESHITTLFERIDHKLVKESEVMELSAWSFDERCFVPLD